MYKSLNGEMAPCGLVHECLIAILEDDKQRPAKQRHAVLLNSFAANRRKESAASIPRVARLLVLRSHEPEFPFCLSAANQYTPICLRLWSILHPFPSQSPGRVR